MHAEITHLEGIYNMLVFLLVYGGALLIGWKLYTVIERLVRNKRRW